MKKLIKTVIKPLLNQRGAMFGMDARIALIVASVLAATGGVTIMSRLERSKVDAAERGVIILKNALETYYRTIGINILPPRDTGIGLLFSSGLIEETTLAVDPWGNPWNYITFSDPTVQIENVDVVVHYAIIYSSGKDGVSDSGNTIFSREDFANWEAQNDDIGIKFSTIEIESERVQSYRAQGRAIINKLEDYAAGQFISGNNVTCPSDPYCETMSDAGETRTPPQYNYYPPSDLDDDESDAVYFDTDVTAEGNVYTAGNINDMYELMKLIGLPTEFATDPWGRVLWYHSNVKNRDTPPFTASICFSYSANCF